MLSNPSGSRTAGAAGTRKALQGPQAEGEPQRGPAPQGEEPQAEGLGRVLAGRIDLEHRLYFIFYF